jgi:hypothetical protein
VEKFSTPVHVTTCNNPKEAIQKVTEKGFDIVLVDDVFHNSKLMGSDVLQGVPNHHISHCILISGRKLIAKVNMLCVDISTLNHLSKKDMNEVFIFKLLEATVQKKTMRQNKSNPVKELHSIVGKRDSVDANNVYVWTNEFKNDLRTLKHSVVAETHKLELRTVEGQMTQLEQDLLRVQKQFEDLQSSIILKERKENKIREKNRQWMRQMNTVIIQQNIKIQSFGTDLDKLNTAQEMHNSRALAAAYCASHGHPVFQCTSVSVNEIKVDETKVTEMSEIKL